MMMMNIEFLNASDGWTLVDVATFPVLSWWTIDG